MTETGPTTCPTCGSDDPVNQSGGFLNRCTDPFHAETGPIHVEPADEELTEYYVAMADQGAILTPEGAKYFASLEAEVEVLAAQVESLTLESELAKGELVDAENQVANLGRELRTTLTANRRLRAERDRLTKALERLVADLTKMLPRNITTMSAMRQQGITNFVQLAILEALTTTTEEEAHD